MNRKPYFHSIILGIFIFCLFLILFLMSFSFCSTPASLSSSTLSTSPATDVYAGPDTTRQQEGEGYTSPVPNPSTPRASVVSHETVEAPQGKEPLELPPDGRQGVSVESAGIPPLPVSHGSPGSEDYSDIAGTESFAPVAAGTDMMAAEPATLVQEDPWADWFVAGASDYVLPDGLYYMDVYINENYYGAMETQVTGGSAALAVEYLSTALIAEVEAAIVAQVSSYADAFIPVAYLEDSYGAMVDFNAMNFEIRIGFGLDAIPVRNISLRQQFRTPLTQLSVEGAEALQPQSFGWATTFQIQNAVSVKVVPQTSWQYDLSVSMMHKVVLWGIGFDFSNFLAYNSRINASQGINSLSLSFGSWRGFKDFPEKNLRLSFGNISGLSGGGSSVGLMLQKSYAYGTGKAKGLSYEQVVELLESSDVEVTINGRTVYRARHHAGTYHLKDFVLSQGANNVVVTVTPVSHPEDAKEYVVSYGYDSSLLGRGDSLYGMSVSMPRSIGTEQAEAVNIPWLNGKYLSYKPSHISFQAWQKVGLTDSVSITTAFGAAQRLFFGTVSSTTALTFGVLTAQVGASIAAKDVVQEFGDIFGLESVLSFKFPSGSGFFSGPLALSLSYATPAYTTIIPSDSATTLSPRPLHMAVSYGGRLGSFGSYSISSQGQVDPSRIEATSGSLSFSVGASLGGSVSVSGSISINSRVGAVQTDSVSGQISLTWSPSRSLSLSSTTTIPGTTGINASFRPQGSSQDSFALSVSSLDIPQILQGGELKPPMQFSWNRSTDLYSLSLRQSAQSAFTDFTTSLTLSTTLVYTGGGFGLTRFTGENVLLISPVGQLRGSGVALSRAGDASAQKMPVLLGSAIYSRLTSNSANTVVAYADDSSAFGSGGSFIFSVPTLSRQFFRVKIDLPRTMTVSGILFGGDGKAMSQYSAPLYSLEAQEDGEKHLVRRDEFYFFTDLEGRYILSDLTPGTYVTELQVGDEWYALLFTLEQQDTDVRQIILFSDLSLAQAIDTAYSDAWWETEGFAGMIEVKQTGVIGEEELWNQIFALPDENS